jgi:uncharacterized membrane protein
MAIENKAPEPVKPSTGMQSNVAGLLCYLGWWITGIIFVIIEKENKTIRFYAWQSIFTFAPITIIQIILSRLGLIPLVGIIFDVLFWIVWIGAIILWVVLMLNAYQGNKFKLPIIGNLAENQVK